MSKASDEIRKAFGEADAGRDEGLTTPADVVRYDDIVYGPVKEWQVLDLYRPKAAEGEVLPVIVSVHGGAWVYGSKEVYQFYCMSLAQQGFAVVNFTYRLAPEYKFPAAIEDINLVMEWIAAHAAQYGLDPTNVFAVGDSAGAHQLGIYANICTTPSYAAEFTFAVPKALTLRAVALNCGKYVIGGEEGAGGSSNGLMADYLEQGGVPEELDRINVLLHLTKNFPPTFVMTCTGDFLQDQALLLIKALMEQKIPHEFYFYGDAEHELPHVFHCNVRSEDAKQCNAEECRFFRRWEKR